LTAICNDIAPLIWEFDSVAISDSYDEVDNRYRGLRASEQLSFLDATPRCTGQGVRRARSRTNTWIWPGTGTAPGPEPGPGPAPVSPPPAPALARRNHGTVVLDTARVGRDAGQIAEEVISHLSGLIGSTVRVTLEIGADVPTGVTDQVVRIVTENARQLGFTNQGFERE
jgi:hypothetical protein